MNFQLGDKVTVTGALGPKPIGIIKDTGLGTSGKMYLVQITSNRGNPAYRRGNASYFGNELRLRN